MKLSPKKSKIYLPLFGILTALIILEIFFRFVTINDLREFIRPYLGQNVLSCRKKHPTLHHVLIPNCSGVVKTRDYSYPFTTNSLGLKDKEIALEKPEGVFRVLVVGDSYVEGWGVAQEEGFVKVAERILNWQGKKVEVINAGVSSYSPILELEYLRASGLVLEPDLVIMMVDPNDMHDEFFYGGWERHFKLREDLFPGSSKNLEIWPREQPPRLIRRILSRSKFFSLFYERIKAHLDTNGKVLTLENLSVDSAIYAKAESWDDYEKAFYLLKDTILLTHQFLKEKGVHFVLTTSSRGAYHNEREWSPGRKVWGFEEGKVYEPKPINIVKKMAEENDVEYINVFAALNNSEIYPLYYPTDGHWTPEAHKIVGEAVASYINDLIEENKDEI